MEPRSVLLQRIDPVQDQHVQVDVQVQRAAKTLDEGHDPGARTAAGRESCPAGEIGLDGADDDRKTAAECVGPAGEEQAQGPGEAENPLTHRHIRNDVVDQMRRRLDHAPRAAGRAEAPTFAGEGDEVLMTAAVALHPHKAVFQLAAAQVVLELGQHEARQWRLVTLQLIPQGRQMSLDDRVERCVLRLMSLIAVA